jgi:nicotinamidase-related amidase
MTKALLLLDLQNEMVDPKGKVGGGGLAKVVEERGVLDRAAAVLVAARRKGLTVAHIRLGFRADYADALSVAPRIARMKEHGACVLDTWGTEFPAKVAPLPEEVVFTKQCVNPFFNTGLMTWLLHRGMTELVLGGVVTNLVVEMTARAADDAGFAVTVLEDCCAAPNAEWHNFSTKNILPLFGRVIASAEFLAELDRPAA